MKVDSRAEAPDLAGFFSGFPDPESRRSNTSAAGC